MWISLQGLQLHSSIIVMSRPRRAQTLNNTVAASRVATTRGVAYTADHAIFQVEHDGKRYVFNANDWNPEQAKAYREYPNGIPRDGFQNRVGKNFVRVLAARDRYLDCRGEGECAAFSVACSRFIYNPLQETVDMRDRIEALAVAACTATSVTDFIRSIL